MLGGWIIGLALAGIVFAILRAVAQRRALRRANGATAGTDAPAPLPPDDARLYQFAGQLEPFYQATAQPADLRGHPIFVQAVAFLNSGRYSTEALLAYACGDNGLISCIALEALAQRRDGTDVVPGILRILNVISFWPRFFALNALLLRAPAQQAVIGLLLRQADASWTHRAPRQMLAEFVRRRLDAGEQPAPDVDFGGLGAEQMEFLDGLLRELADPRLQDVAAALATARRNYLDVEFMRAIGSFWNLGMLTGGGPPGTAHSDAVTLEHPALLAHVVQLETMLLQQPRSAVLVGESGVGKTAIVRALARRLLERQWTFFEASATELLAGQSHVGELEGRLQTLVRNLENKPHVVWYVPDFANLRWAGRHMHNPTGVLDFLLPHLESGRLVILGEAQPSAFERLLQAKSRLQSAVTAVRVEPLTEAQTLQLGAQWLALHEPAEAAPAGGSAALLTEAWNLAQQFLSDKSAPGNLMLLLQGTLQRLRDERSGAAAPPVQLRSGDLVTTLAQLTGLPESILDERHVLDLHQLRTLFERRVMGQPEAVQCLIERVAMIKAGVTDPRRPVGVFLFAGPTGTGKTEIALTLAEFLFGSASRLVRIDMSELQGPTALGRILGSHSEPDQESLADRIRKQPFSVVLLDEFEKADPPVWDLFLQVFDAGRLTDHAGNTVDFRHAILIMTSNLGSVVQAGGGLGFRTDSASFHTGAVGRAVSRSFSPEFLNRIDRLVVFQPLAKATMRSILIRELDEALQRRGLRHRAWAVEWGDDAIEFLLDKGFTADLGARPLKRAIERYVLAPLAVTIVNHEVPKGDQFLFVRADGDKLAVQFVDPDAPDALPAADGVPQDGGLAAGAGADPAGDAASAGAGARLEPIAFAPRGTRAEVDVLRQHLMRLRTRVESEAWQQSKQSALSMTALPDFWRSNERFAILGEAEYMERVERGVRNAASFFERIAGSGNARRETYPRDLVGRSAEQMYLLDLACATVAAREPRDAFLRITGEKHGPGARASADFARRLTSMYQGWAKKRGMQWHVLDDAAGDAPYEFVAAVSGYASYRILRNEDGLHVHETPVPGEQSMRLVKAHLQVVPQPEIPAGHEPGALRKQAEAALRDAGAGSNTIVRRYRELPDPLVRDAVRKWRTPHYDRVMAGDFDLLVEND